MNIFLQHLAQNDGNEAEDAFKYLTEEKDEGCENRNIRAGGCERQQSGIVSRLWVMVNAAPLAFCLCLLPHASLQLKQLHIKNKGCVWWDNSGVACCSISHIRCTGDFSPLAQAHLQHRRGEARGQQNTLSIYVHFLVLYAYARKVPCHRTQNTF